ncbi:sodium/potassium-transporting ATPase subunit alpha-like [Schistocerca gregaria]|uniref:sodium/potassium-transporting ATPase subunit alpha-like n=1 Tax=Schistocerca gregaria TaxID=7010 RepID=UPI00211EDC42|nr:sodium/potassium-transporting ATPase subunit alpha-like [Schistocerca gregaria]
MNREVFIDDHLIPLRIFYQRHHTDPDNGLSDERAALLLSMYGPNKLKRPPQENKFIRFLKNFFGGFAVMLWVGSLLCFITFSIQSIEADYDHLYLGVVLVTVVIITGLFTHYQQSKSGKVLEAFQSMLPEQATVIRDGRKLVVSAEDIVLGDVVDLRAGDKVPADMRIIECQGLKVDNSSLTGESEPQPRTTEPTSDVPFNTHNMAFYSTLVVSGTGRGVVVSCGDSSAMGRIAELTSGLKSAETPIAREIKHFVRLITWVAIAAGFVIGALSLSMGYHWLDAVVILIGIIVANVPEGLLVTVTVCLTLSAQRMARKNCLVKHLEAVETLGSTSVICSDKTGTLTQNRMTVSHVWFEGEVVAVDTSAEPRFDNLDVTDEQFLALARVAMLCSRAEFDAEQLDLPVYARRVFGDASETAILKFLEAALGGVEEYRQQHQKVFEIPFSSDTKYQVSVHRTKEDGPSEYLMVMKGAPERLLERCTRVLMGVEEHPLDHKWRLACQEAYGQMMAMGERVLGFCDLALPPDTYNRGYVFDAEKQNFPQTGMRFVGFMSLVDPPRPGVLEAVRKCRSAGIRVIMVTGDHPTTAAAIARAVGIFTVQHSFDSGAARRFAEAAHGTPTPAGSGHHLPHGGQTPAGSHQDLPGQAPGLGQAVARHPSLLQDLGTSVAARYPSLVYEPYAGIARQPSLLSERPTRDSNWPPLTAPGRQPSFFPQQDQLSRQGSLLLPPTAQPRTAALIHGDDLRDWSSEELDNILSTYDEFVFARTSPTQKLSIVESCQRLGYIVAVTGDGVNDAPALKQADIGVAMGVTGSDVAKQAADMILLDDNFATIVTGVEEGRVIFDNLKKSIAYTLTSNTPEMLPFAVSVLAKVPLPLGIMAILCINIGTDLWPAISLAYEQAEQDIMTRRPRDPVHDKLVNSRLICIAYLHIGQLQAAAGFFAYFTVMALNGFMPCRLFGLLEEWNAKGIKDLQDSWGREWTYEARKDLEYMCHTAFFVAIVVVQWADLLICKTRKVSLLQQGMRNWPLNLGLLVCSAMACVMVYTPGVNTTLRLRPLRPELWLCGAPWALLILFYDEVRRYLIRKHPGGWVDREFYY